MDSESRKHHRRTKHRVTGASRSSSGKRRKSSSIRASSSFASISVAPSRAPVVIHAKKPPAQSECAGFLWALLGVCILILLGGGHHVYALGVALLLPGLALLLRPPARSLGKWMDVGIVGLLASLLFAFLPLFYWQNPSWRTTAVDVFGIDLPVVLSVQPWISFEAFLSAVAGFSWLYAASAWKVNYEGRRWIYFAVSCGIAVFAVAVIFGNLLDWRYPGAEDSTAFSFFPNRNQTSNFIAIGGVLAFGYAMEGLRGRKLTHLVGFVASMLSLGALVYGVSRAGVMLYFGGVCLWFIFGLRRTVVSLFFKIGLPVVLLIFSFFISSHETAVGRATEFIASPVDWGTDFRSLVYRDTLHMIEEAPLTGVGVGNFSAVFPQYRNLSRSGQHALHPESDLFWLGAEGGIIAVLFLAILLVSYFKKCRASGAGRSGAYRMIALTGVLMFLVHGVFDVSGHRPGTAYFAIIFVALALPRAAGKRPTFRPVIWRGLGGGLIVVGVLWIVGGVFQLPTHSTVALAIQEQRAAEGRSLNDLDRASEAVDQLIALRPLDWSGYFQRAQIRLSRGGARAGAVQDFRRVRFVEPNIAMVAYEEGLAWLPYDVKRTVSAWREALVRYIDSKDGLFDRMLRKASQNQALMEGMIEMVQVDPDYRARLILSLRGEVFNREIEKELSVNPMLGEFTREHRTALVKRWIHFGEFDKADAYVLQYGETLNDAWFLSAMLRSDQAQYQEAVELMREALPVPEIPEVTVDLSRIDRLRHSFFMSSNDLSKGTALLSYYLEGGEYQEALGVVDALMKQANAPSYVSYWRAEVSYQLEEYSESWYAFKEYWEQINE